MRLSWCGPLARNDEGCRVRKRVLIHPDSDTQKLKDRLCVYGMSIQRYRNLLVEQGGKCAICEQLADAFVVDHNHHTGRVRGLLCHRCNAGLGSFYDSSEMLERAVEYLRELRPIPDVVASSTTRRLMRRLRINGPSGFDLSTVTKRQAGRAVSQVITFGWAQIENGRLCITRDGERVEA